MNADFPRSHWLVKFLVVAVALSLVDAVAGRLLQAHPDPSAILRAMGGFLVVRRILQVERPAVGALWGLAFAATSLVAFKIAADLLVGWNQSRPWTLTAVMQYTVLLAGLVGGAVGAQSAGKGARPFGGSDMLARWK